MVKRYSVYDSTLEYPTSRQPYVLASDFDRLEAACRQEHGGKYDEPECQICEALRSTDSGEGKS